MADRLLEGLVLMHPWISGELACGHLQNRVELLSDLGSLPGVPLASDEEVKQLIENKQLWGYGIGWVDMHLLASTLLAGCRLWTLDKKLARAADELGVK